MKQISAWIPVNQVEEIERRAKKAGIRKSDIIRALIADALLQPPASESIEAHEAKYHARKK